ncbi:MAG: competence damage-inducible protein A [Candidatus Bathyarchaeota archaeon]|nr:MAG: competence damage-inducible protein A [Candidatus Bathyarchaeota archaeon]
MGTELLIGKTLNTNANWLAKRITNLGAKVERITVIGDDVGEISSVMKNAMQRNNDFIITLGGLGPTFDDKTLEGIAKALNLKLEINDEALKMIKKRYRSYMKEGQMKTFELTQPRVKMARLPEAAEPLPNPVGTAPAVLTNCDGKTVISLPGVPSEMKAISETTVLPILKKITGGLAFSEKSIVMTGVVESEMAPIIDEVMHNYPRVYIKSHPKGAERIPKIELHLSTTAEDPKIAKERVSRALRQLSERIQKKGGKIRHARRKI